MKNTKFKFLSFILSFILLLTGCDILFDNSLSSSGSENNYELKLLSFKAIDNSNNNNKNARREKKEKENIQEIIVSEENNILYFETIVKNDNRLSFVDMEIYISHLNIQVVYNEGNGNYICSSTTIYEDNLWKTKINFSLSISFENVNETYGYVEVKNIYFLDTNSSKIETEVDSVSVKKINFHQHYSNAVLNEINPCLFENYQGYECSYCGENIFISGKDLDPDKHEYEEERCKYCGISKMATYSFEVVSNAGDIISNTKIEIKLNNDVIGTIVSDNNGKASIILERKKYTAQVIECNLGLTSDILSIEEGVNKLEILYGVIKGSKPDDYVYSEGVLIYDFNFTDINNITHTFSEVLEGKQGAIILFFASWDVWSLSALEDLETYYNSYGKKFEIIALCIDGGSIQNIVDEYNLSYYLSYDVDMKIYSSYGLNVSPVYIFVNKVGQIKKIQQGFIMDSNEFSGIIKSSFSI